MPDQSSAAKEHALMQEIQEPLASLPADAVPGPSDTEFPTVLRGYDKFAVDAYVRQTNQLLAELQARSSPSAAVRRALERVGEDVSGILQRAHDTAETITSGSRREAEDRLEVARREASQLTAWARDRVKELDVDTDRIWAERDRIVGDARELARQLLDLADEAAARFPAEEPPALSGDGDVKTDDSGAADDTAATRVLDASELGSAAHAPAAAFTAPGLDEEDPAEAATTAFDPETIYADDLPEPGAEADSGDDTTADFEAVRVRPNFDPTRTQAFRPIRPEAEDDSAAGEDEGHAEQFRPFDAEADGGADASDAETGDDARDGDTAERPIGELRFSDERDDEPR